MRSITMLMLFTSILLFLMHAVRGSIQSDYRLNEEERENGLRNFDYHEKIEDNQENMKDIHESEEENKAANYYSNDDIELALSGLTTNELQLLSHLVEEEDSIKSKRDTSKLKKKLKLSNKERIEDEEETDYDNDYMEMSSSKKRANCRGLCQAGSCIHSTREIEDEEEENEDEGRLNKRKFTPFRKRNSESPEKKIKARISSLKDKAKIHSFVFFNKPGRLSNDFNYEPQVRGKRSVPSELTAKADDPQSPEHLKQLEESFPNPASINTFHQPDFNLVRVKRDDH